MCNLTEKDYRPSRKLCSNHFEKKCYRVGYARKTLIYGSIPTIFTKKEPGCSMVKQEPEDESIKHVVIKQEFNKIETPIEKKSSHEEQSFVEDRKKFCPTTMVRYDSMVQKKPEDESIKHVAIKQELNKIETPMEKKSSHEEQSFVEDRKKFCPTTMVRYDSMVQKKPEDESIKDVVIEQELNKIETPMEKKSSHEEQSFVEDRKKFCPTTMVRYDCPHGPYKTHWVCRNCLSVMLSEDAVHGHVKKLCKHKYVADFGLGGNDIEDVNDEGNREDDVSGNVN